jgi:hypothetical protein
MGMGDRDFRRDDRERDREPRDRDERFRDTPPPSSGRASRDRDRKSSKNEDTHKSDEKNEKKKPERQNQFNQQDQEKRDMPRDSQKEKPEPSDNSSRSSRLKKPEPPVPPPPKPDTDEKSVLDTKGAKEPEPPSPKTQLSPISAGMNSGFDFNNSANPGNSVASMFGMGSYYGNGTTTSKSFAPPSTSSDLSDDVFNLGGVYGAEALFSNRSKSFGTPVAFGSSQGDSEGYGIGSQVMGISDSEDSVQENLKAGRKSSLRDSTYLEQPKSATDVPVEKSIVDLFVHRQLSWVCQKNFSYFLKELQKNCASSTEN